jgi:hypothetical protein
MGCVKHGRPVRDVRDGPLLPAEPGWQATRYSPVNRGGRFSRNAVIPSA